jgi:ATP-binding cassette subfamily B protein
MNPFLEDLPAAVDRKLSLAKERQEEVLIQVATDMAGRERFEERWLVVTQKQLGFLHANGSDGVVQLPMDAVQTARIEALVGGGRLEVERKQGPPAFLYYSNSLAPKFAEVAEGINQLSRGDQLVLPTAVEQSRCAQCGRMLPEKDGICPACTRKWDTLQRLIGYMLPYRLKFLLLLGIIVGSTGLQLVPPLFVQYIIDDVLTPRAGFDLLIWPVLGLLGLNVVTWLAAVGRRWLGAWVGLRAIENMRAELYRALQYLPLRFYDKRKVGALVSRMNNDSDLVEEYLIYDIPYVLSNILKVVGSLGLLLYMNWELALYVLLPVAPIVVGGSLIWSRLESYWRRWSAKWSRLSSHLNESISGIRVVKAFAQEERENERFGEHNRDLCQISVSAERSWLVFFMVTNFLMGMGVFLVWYFGGRQILDGALKLGALMAFIHYLWILYEPLRWLGDFYGFMVRAYAGAERIFEVIDSRSEPFDDAAAQPMPAIEGRVCCRDMDFGYDPGKPILKEIELDVKPGEMIGLVGKSGVGKSTLINMICRFYDPTRGSLEIDGVDVRAIQLRDLRRQIGLVAQHSFLFSGTIAENISYGKSAASFDEIVRAARAANAHEFIITQLDGYDTRVGEEGNNLSGGEKQRLAIARAILHDPKILILDEATSSLDTPTEKKIQEAIARLVQGRTTFAIAHRLSTLRSADRLVVMDEGKIVEVGTHEELMGREGFFYNLVKVQQETTAVMAVGGE